MTTHRRRRDRRATPAGEVGTGDSSRSRKTGQILSAARGLFLERGFDPVTMDVVARVAGVSKATLYVHFASKEELFARVMTDEARRVTDEVWVTEPGFEDVESVLRRAAQNFFSVFMTERAFLLQRAVAGAMPRFPAVGRAVFDSGPATLIGKVATFLATAHDGGRLHVSNPTLAALQFLSTVRGDIDVRGMLAIEMPSQKEIDARIEEGIKMFMLYYEKKR